MAKIIHPVLFSERFDIDLLQYETTNAFDPTLNVDTKLFIDPLLLDTSKNILISKNATERFDSYFEDIITLLKSSTQIGDISWREADRRMTFKEISATCLGYGAATIRGSALGKKLRENLLKTAKKIISLGIEEPKLFVLLPLLENDIGADRISDITTKIILPDLAIYTENIARELSIPTKKYTFDEIAYNLPKNVTEQKDTPVILVPKDILSKLPVATDWAEVADVSSKNSTLRKKVNQHIGKIWRAKNRKDKAKLKQNVLSSREAVETLLTIFETSEIPSYNFDLDPAGLVSWRNLLKSIATDFPCQFLQKGQLTPENAIEIVKQINKQFAFLIEKRGLSKLLWVNKTKPHHERVSQMVYFAVADSYCKANNLDKTPEADTGTGAVDFKFSQGYSLRILVEIKLSTNPRVISGYEKQLTTYSTAEQTPYAEYIVIDVGKMGKKDQAILKIKNDNSSRGKQTPEITFIDGSIQLSASKRK